LKIFLLYNALVVIDLIIIFMQKVPFITVVLLSFLVSGCLPVIFTGATASVTELAKDRPADEALKDFRIASAIKASFIKNNFRELYTKIKVEVVQGRVLYTGLVDKEEDMINAVQIAWDQEGVTEVVNELKVDKNSGKFDIVQYTRDTMITSQIKSKTFLDRSIKFVNYTVITVNDVVYLFGMARSEEELQKVATIASNIKVGDYTPKTKSSGGKQEEEETLLIDEGESSDFKNEQESVDSW
jgi:osmotically-inducible protein OsmY